MKNKPTKKGLMSILQGINVAEVQRKAQLHDKIAQKTLEIINENNILLKTVIIPKIEKIEKKMEKK